MIQSARFYSAQNHGRLSGECNDIFTLKTGLGDFHLYRLHKTVFLLEIMKCARVLFLLFFE